MKGQRQVLLIAGAALVAAILYQFVFLPGRKQVASLKTRASRMSADLARLESLCAQYERLRAEDTSSRAATVSSDFSLLDFIGQVVEKTQTRSQMRSVKPLPDTRIAGYQQERVECAVENISLEKVCELLEALQDGTTPVYLPSFRLRKNRDRPSLLNLEFEAMVLKAQQAPAAL